MKLGPRDAATLLALAAGGYVAWRAYQAGTAGLAAAGRAADAAVAGVSQALAEVQQAWGNLGNLPATGDPLKRLLYAGTNYTGLDESGQPISDAVITSTPEARRYLYDYAQGAAAQGQPLPVTTSAGAAFGIYPSAGRRQVKP